MPRLTIFLRAKQLFFLKIAGFLLAFIVLGFLSAADTQAATKYWIGSAGGNFSDNANWSTTSGSACGVNNNTTAPTSSDVATFASDCTNNATLDTTIAVQGLTISSGYTGTISPSGSPSITIGTSGFSQAAGTFTTTSGTTTLNGILNITGGTFNHNSGTLSVAVHSTTNTFTTNGTTFNNVTFHKVSSGDEITTFQDSFTINGNLTVQADASGGLHIRGLNSAPTVTINGNLSITDGAGFTDFGYFGSSQNFSVSLKGDLSLSESVLGFYALLTFSGTGDQNISITSGFIDISSPATWTVNKTSGAVIQNSDLTMGGSSSFVLTSGTFTAGAYNTTFYRYSQGGGTYNASSGTTTFQSTTSITSGTFNHNNGTVKIITGSNFSISLNNAALYNLIISGPSSSSGDRILTISSSDFSVENDMTVSNPNTSSGTVTVRNSGGRTITVGGNLNFPSVAQTGTIIFGTGSGLAINLAGNLTMSESDVTVNCNVTLNGSGDQTITQTAGSITGSTWTVNKSSGTTYLGANFNINGSPGNLALTSGVFDLNGYNLALGGNLSRTSGSLANTSGRTITLSGTTQAFNPGSVTFGNFIMTGSSGTTTLGSSFSVSSAITVPSGRTLALSSFTLTATNATITNSGTINEGTGKVIRNSSNLYLANSNFDIKSIFSLGSDAIYVSINDEDGNLNGGSANSLSGMVISCPTDSEAITLTETGNATSTFRNSGLTTATYSGSATNNNGTLTCADGVTITATYTDPQDSSDTRSTTANATTDTIPADPSGLFGEALSSTSIKWTWYDNATDEDGFRLYDENNNVIVTVNTPTAGSGSLVTYTETGLTKGTSYTRKGAAFNDAGTSGFSNSDTILTPSSPNAPSGLVGEALSSTSIKWTWYDNSDNEDGFRLYDENSNVVVVVNESTAGSGGLVTYIESGFVKGATITRKGAAFNSDGTSAFSNSDTVTTLTDPPADFSLISPESGSLLSTNKPTFSFHKSSDSDDGIDYYLLVVGSNSYTIPKNADSASSPGTKTHSTDDFTAQYWLENDGNDSNDYISVTLKNALSDASYNWYVKAYDLGGNSKQSATRSFVIDATTPQIAGLTISGGTLKNGTYALTTTNPSFSFSTIDTGGIKNVTITLKKAIQLLGVTTGYQTIETKIITGQSAITYTPSLVADNLYTLVINIEDIAGNITTQTLSLRVPSTQSLALLAVNDLDASSSSLDSIVTTLRDSLPKSVTNIPELQEQAAQRREEQANQFSSLMAKLASYPLLDRVTAYISNAAHTSVDFLALIKSTINGAATKLASAFTSMSGANFVSSIMQPIVTTIDSSIASAREVRIRSSLANRQLITRNLQGFIKPLQSGMVKLALHSRELFETYLSNKPTIITDVTITEVSPTSIALSWRTNHLTRLSKVNYGTTNAYGNDSSIEELSDKHDIVLQNLDPNTQYFFEVMNQTKKDYVFDAYYSVETLTEGSPSIEMTPKYAYLTGAETITIFSEASPVAEIKTSLSSGTFLRLLVEKDGWATVQLPDGTKGYIPLQYVTIVQNHDNQTTAQRSYAPTSLITLPVTATTIAFVMIFFFGLQIGRRGTLGV